MARASYRRMSVAVYENMRFYQHAAPLELFRDPERQDCLIPENGQVL